MLKEKTAPRPYLIERRSERRIAVSLPVEVSGTDAAGKGFTERTFIEDVSNFGCRFSTVSLLREGDTVSLRPIAPRAPLVPAEEARIYEIKWVAPKPNGGGCIVGARLREGVKLMEVDSLPDNGKPPRESP